MDIREPERFRLSARPSGWARSPGRIDAMTDPSLASRLLPPARRFVRESESTLANASGSPRARRPRGAFTLTEMLVVIGIIALLLPALSRVQERARKTQTENLMQGFLKACEAFHQQFGFYPGIVPEAILANDPKISGTENAILHLCGGGITEDDPNWNVAPYTTWQVIEFNAPAPQPPFRIKINPAKVGEGPRIRGVQYKAFFSGKASDLVPISGQSLATFGSDPFANDPFQIPDLVDSWGQPIIYMRQMRPSGSRLVAGESINNMSDCIFAFQPLRPYVQSASLGELGQSQLANSILNTAAAIDRDATLAQIIRNVSYGAGDNPLAGASRGAIVLISAGRDGIYFANNDGPGAQGAVVNNIVSGTLNPKGAYVVNEYDDIRIFGGG